MRVSDSNATEDEVVFARSPALCAGAVFEAWSGTQSRSNGSKQYSLAFSGTHLSSYVHLTIVRAIDVVALVAPSPSGSS